jgi:hypothetical protein
MGAHLSLFYAACARIIVNHGSASRLYLVDSGAADESPADGFLMAQINPFEKFCLCATHMADFSWARARVRRQLCRALMIMTRHVSMEPKRRRRDVRNEMNTNSRMCVCLPLALCAKAVTSCDASAALVWRSQRFWVV